MSDVIISSDAPASATYSQGMLIPSGTKLIKIAGQVAFNTDMKLVGAGDLQTQVKQVFHNLGVILQAGGARPGDLTSVTVVLVRAEDFIAFNQLYAEWEWIKDQKVKPTRITFVAGLTVEGALIEMQCEAAV